MEKSPILLQVAMEVECSCLLKKIDHLVKREIGGYLFYEGMIRNYPVVISLSKVGLIEASSSLTIGIENYHPIAIINYGIAGATTRKLHVSDMVIGTNCVNINSYKSSFSPALGGVHPDKWELLTFLSGETDRFLSYSSDEKLLALALGNPPKTNYLCGTIGSGDVWNQEVDRVLFLNEKYHILCEDMESISTYTIAHHRDIPVISFKMISDNLLLGEEYDREVGIYLQEYVFSYVEKLIGNFL